MPLYPYQALRGARWWPFRPPFADWSAPTFVAAWSQRMVIAVQSTNACVALRNFTRSLTAAQVGRVGGSVDWSLDRLG